MLWSDPDPVFEMRSDMVSIMLSDPDSGFKIWSGSGSGLIIKI